MNSISRFAAFLSLIIVGCAAPHGKSQQGQDPYPDIFVACIDVSDPTKQVLLEHARAIYRQQRALPRDTKVRVYLFGLGDELVYDGPPITSREVFNERIAAQVNATSVRGKGTHPEVLLGHLAEDTAKAQGRFSIVIATDGGVEDHGVNAIRALERSIRALSGSAECKGIAVVNVKSAFRRQWEQWLKPLGSSRGIVKGKNDADKVVIK